MKNRLLNLLERDAILSIEEIAVRLNIAEDTVRMLMKELIAERKLVGYKAILPDVGTSNLPVQALIEVKVAPRRDRGFDTTARRIARFPEVVRLYLVSGGYDLLLEVEGDSLQTVAGFVSARLATIDGVLSTATSFQLKKYKESGKIMTQEDEYERLPVTP